MESAAAKPARVLSCVGLASIGRARESSVKSRSTGALRLSRIFQKKRCVSSVPTRDSLSMLAAKPLAQSDSGQQASSDASRVSRSGFARLTVRLCALPLHTPHPPSGCPERIVPCGLSFPSVPPITPQWRDRCPRRKTQTTPRLRAPPPLPLLLPLPLPPPPAPHASRVCWPAARPPHGTV